MTWVESSVATVCVVVTVVSRVVRVCANANGAMNAQLRMIAIVFIRFSLRNFPFAFIRFRGQRFRRMSLSVEMIGI
jgi:hypothetical protein